MCRYWGKRPRTPTEWTSSDHDHQPGVAGQIVMEEIDGDEGDMAGGICTSSGTATRLVDPGSWVCLPRSISPSIAEAHVSRVCAGALDACMPL